MSFAPKIFAKKTRGVAARNAWKLHDQIKPKWHGEKLVNMPNYIFKMMKTKEEAPDNCVTFKVPLNVNKPIIKNYLEEIYNVKIAKVNTQVYLGKVKRWRNGSFYKLKDWKKAIVFLENEEDAIEFPKLDELNEQYDKSRVEHKHVLK